MMLKRHKVIRAAIFSDDLQAELRLLADAHSAQDDDPAVLGGLLDHEETDDRLT